MVLDSDVIIRALTVDDPKKAERFRKYLQSPSELILTDVTIAEIFWTLSSFYKFKKSLILSSLETLIRDPAILCNSDLIRKAISILMETNLSFIDAYTSAYSIIKSDSRILSFDRGYDKLKEIRRIEP